MFQFVFEWVPLNTIYIKINTKDMNAHKQVGSSHNPEKVKINNNVFIYPMPVTLLGANVKGKLISWPQVAGQPC